MTSLLFRPPPGVIEKNKALWKQDDSGYWPHLFDVYIPPGTVDYVLIALHSSGSNKYDIARLLNVAYAPNPQYRQVSWNLLNKYNTAVICVQGQHCDGTVSINNPDGVTTVDLTHPAGLATWSNAAMYSGADDVGFLTELASNYVSVTWPAAKKVLFGHGEGSTMVSRMWLESSPSYDAYVGFSGSLSRAYEATPLPVPSPLKPMYQRFSLNDTILGIKDGVAGVGDHFWDNSWAEQPAQSSVADVNYPALSERIAGWRVYQRAVTYSGGSFSQSGYTQTAEVSGWMRTWNYSGGTGNRQTMEVLQNPDHSLTSQIAATGRYIFSDVLDWAIQTFT